MPTIRSQCRIKQFAAAALLASIGSTAASATQLEPAPTQEAHALVMPGYGPGVAGHVIEGPSTPVCRPDIPCKKPFADASVLIVDQKTRDSVGEVVTNTSGNFLITEPPGVYVVHVHRVGLYPRCADVQVTVGQIDFTPVQINCDTGIR